MAMSEKPSSTRNLRQLSISIPSGHNAPTGLEKASGEGENVIKSDATAAPENPRVEESLEEKLLKQKLQAALPGVSSVVSTPGTTGTPNPLLGTNSSVVSVDLPNTAGPNVINKQLLSKLNKSLKEKQKVIQTKESHTKTPTLIQDILTTLPLQPVFSHNSPMPSLAQVNEVGRSTSPGLESTGDDQEAESGMPPTVAAKEPEPKPKTKKRIAKQNSTRTDFFAAKLASAVDDVSLSNSDETFVYENNVNDFGDEATGESGPNSGIPGSGVITTGDEAFMTGASDISNHLANDTASVAGSVRNATLLEGVGNSPFTELRKDLHDEHKPDQVRAESIHSFQSTKVNPRNTFNITPPNTSNGRLLQPPNLAHVDNPAQYLNPYFHNLIRDASNKATRRKSSSHSLMSEDKSYILRSPMLNFSDPNHTLVPQSHSLATNIHLPVTPSIAEGYGEGTCSLDEEDDEDLSGDDGASSLRLVSTESKLNNTITNPNDGYLKADHLSVSGKTEKKSKPSTTSSKLRSTTSKLFDKKGAQPRRYSTIPDDIDIEDFDDELIYYDNNNIRFPYNSQNGNETSSLLGGTHRLPHHRSLNLSFNGKRQTSNAKPKRYTSLGYVPSNGKGNDIFPFPYPEPNQKYYYDFDEYDEDEHADGRDEMHAKGISVGKNHLSPNNAHFFLPRKVSRDNFGNNRVRFIKSFVYTLISIICILAIGFILGFLLASTKDLANISIINIENPLVSQDELVFSIIVEALNPGWFTVEIEEVEIDIFAKSGYLDGPAGTSVETVLLGTVFNFESALVFDGGFFNKELSQQRGEIKLIAPGKNLTGSSDPMQALMGYKLRTTDKLDPPDNSEKWALISKHPFDLILRGVLKYNLPMTTNIRSAVVNKVGYVDPSTPGVDII
ncbi:CIC11C00000000739 [Sungouiella intermedia]|uniref:CIC11C00000000739 n=1 Tax=Sungouiella intermedia TaxID=45354 RepID=A0A1L0DJZ4_9ASCO|nr:CIC11C00000000739 [[Candida] intermedia]